MKLKFSQRIQNVMEPPLPELSSKIARFSDGISLGQGSPFFIPPEEALGEFRQRMGKDGSIHRYSLDEGLPEVRELVASLLVKKGIDASWEEILMTSGANEACYVSVLTCCDPGDEAVVVDPFYFNHYMDLQLANMNPLLVSTTNTWEIDIDVLEKMISQRTKLIIINTPNNPTGAVYSEKTLKRLVDVCHEYDLFLLSDETYDLFLYDGARHISPASISSDAQERVITVGSFSKVLGMPGWRLGYLHASPEFVSQALKAHDSIAICPPRPSQVLFQLCYPYIDDFIKERLKELQESRVVILRRLHELSSVFDVVPTTGAFYLFPRIIDSRWMDRDVDFVYHVLDNAHVLMIPGSFFGSRGRGHVRIAFGNVGKDKVNEAFDRLESLF